MLNMISERAKFGCNSLLSRCLGDSLRSSVFPAWTMVPLNNETEISHRQFIMLTISSYDFRMVVLLHFSRSAPLMKYVADMLKLSPEVLEQSRFDDYLAELGNTFCGAFKRALGNFFPYLGMSTPNVLFSESLKYVKTWPVEYETHLRAHDGGQVAFYGSLYVTSSGNLDFHVKELSSRVDDVQTGALEMF